MNKKYEKIRKKRATGSAKMEIKAHRFVTPKSSTLMTPGCESDRRSWNSRRATSAKSSPMVSIFFSAARTSFSTGAEQDTGKSPIYRQYFSSCYGVESLAGSATSLMLFTYSFVRL